MSRESGSSPTADIAMALVRRLTSAHHGLKVRGDKLIVTPRPPEDLAVQIRAHRDALLALVVSWGGEVPPDPFPEQCPPPELPRVLREWWHPMHLAGRAGAARPEGPGGGS